MIPPFPFNLLMRSPAVREIKVIDIINGVAGLPWPLPPARILRPQAAFSDELHGLAFLRAMEEDPAQLAWDACEDPWGMIRIIGDHQEPGPAQLLLRGASAFGQETFAALKGASPWDHPDAAMRLVYVLAEIAKPETDTLRSIDLTVTARGTLDGLPAAQARLAWWMRQLLPLAPCQFSL